MWSRWRESTGNLNYDITQKSQKNYKKKKNKIGNSRFLSALYVQTQSTLLKLPLPATKI